MNTRGNVSLSREKNNKYIAIDIYYLKYTQITYIFSQQRHLYLQNNNNYTETFKVYFLVENAHELLPSVRLSL